jgi:hypothetical protein
MSEDEVRGGIDAAAPVKPGEDDKARAPDASMRPGNSLVRSTKRVGNLPVQAALYFRSIVRPSSPLMDSRRSVMAAWSCWRPKRASAITAAGLPISGWSPKLVASPASVGPATFSCPSMAVSVRAIVPFPLRRGPTINKIF